MEAILEKYPFLKEQHIPTSKAYEPLVECAVKDDFIEATAYLNVLAEIFLQRFPEEFKSHEEAVERIKYNLDYVCQFYGAEKASKTKEMFDLGQGFNALGVKTDIPIKEITPEQAFQLGLEAGERISKAKQ